MGSIIGTDVADKEYCVVMTVVSDSRLCLVTVGIYVVHLRHVNDK